MAKLGREVVNALLMGPSAEGRLVHESPVRGDVWAALAAAPGRPVDILIEAYRNVETGLVASRLARRLYGFRSVEGPVSGDHAGFGISYVEGFVAARLGLEDLTRYALPYSAWARDLRTRNEDRQIAADVASLVREQMNALAEPGDAIREADPKIARMAATFRMLAGLYWALDQEAETYATLAEFLAAAKPDELGGRAGALVEGVLERAGAIVRDGTGPEEDAADIFAISRNRPVELALERSIPAVKADAVTALFAVSCNRIGWAVLDSGIDGRHPAFDDARRPGSSRVVATYDFTRLRDIVLIDHLYNPTLLDRHAAELSGNTGRSHQEVFGDLLRLARDAQARRPIDWAIAERYVAVSGYRRPGNPHGTHVAGILGGCWPEASIDPAAPPLSRRGVCTDIRLYDFRVVAGTVDDSEFAVVGALQFIRHLNSRNNYPQIHGANISLSIRHDVRNYACGRTPVCEEADRVVSSGVVVVAAAGNRGYQSYHLTDGSAFETYAPSSITDPGNAEAVITVGATHRSAPHSYGVSFFSSRGPTGDGRPKPDLVAPGEKIWSVVPGKSEDSLSGTSMAAPHVSGAAALLMARNPEFIGQAATIKRILCGSCTDLGREKMFQGAGMLDILRAMQSV